MALTGTIVTHAGVTTHNQYIKILNVKVNKSKMDIQTAFYNSKQDSDESTPPYEVTDYMDRAYDLDGNNPLVQGYNYLKQNVHNDCVDS